MKDSGTFFFITTNPVWSGSEELWSRSALQLRQKGFAVIVSMSYDHSPANEYGFSTAPYHRRHLNLPVRLLERMRVIPGPNARFVRQLKANKPNVVVISQGDIISSLEVMEACKHLAVPFVTITQLVADVHFLFI